jgi:Pentapeptide repeats (8 copies)
MANNEHVAQLRKGVAAWNERGANLNKTNLSEANLMLADLVRASLLEAKLSGVAFEAPASASGKCGRRKRWVDVRPNPKEKPGDQSSKWRAAR